MKENIKPKNNDEFPLKLVQHLNMSKNAFAFNVTWSLVNNSVGYTGQVESPIYRY